MTASKGKSRAGSRPIAVEFFCGVGGMTLGFKHAGFDVVGAYDIDQTNVDYHALNFPGSKTFKGDVTKLTGDGVRAACGIGDKTIDAVYGGPPCQGFSEIGRKEAGDKRNLLILEFARLVGELEPRYFVVENVRGLLYSYSSKILKRFERKIRSLGYEIVKPIKLLDATHYGVPQRRQRAFILGYQKGLPVPAYPEPLCNEDDSGPTVADAIGDIPDLTKHLPLRMTDTYGGPLGQPSEYLRRIAKRFPAEAGVEEIKGLTGCMLTTHSDDTLRRFADTSQGSYEEVSRCFRLSLSGVAHTLRAGSDNKNGSFSAARPIHPTQDRYLTTREAARLHSYPDWFRFHPTKWHGFRQVGNSVPPLMAYAVATEVLRATKAAKRSKGERPKAARRRRAALSAAT